MTVPTDSRNSLPILVGIDGSNSSKLALKWAANQARLTGLPLESIATWDWPITYGTLTAIPEDVDLAADAEHNLNDTLSEVLGDDRPSQLSQKVLRGHPSLVLARLSRSASLVVVGSQGRGAFAGMLLGSVSEYLAMHAHCPVVIVRTEKEQEDDLSSETTK